MALKAMMISGPFSEDDIAEMADAMRAIERRNPDGVYKLMVNDLESDVSLQEMAIMLERIFPRVAGDDPVFTTMPRES